MTPEDIIRLAQKVWSAGNAYIGPSISSLSEFAALAIAAERERVTFELVNEAQRAVQEAVWAEREACAKMCEDWPMDEEYVYSIATAIRARGEK